jgi:hypothetical protein
VGGGLSYWLMGHMEPGERGGLQGAALRGMREYNDLIVKGRLWLRDSPEKPIVLAPAFLGAHTPLVFVCACCIGRLRGRGCHVEQLATRNVFTPDLAPAPCELCGNCAPTPTPIQETTQAAR